MAKHELPAWHEWAACRGADQELFFADEDPAKQASALRFCSACPVRNECLEAAFLFEKDVQSLAFGVWGGMRAKQRAKFYARKRRQQDRQRQRERAA